MTDPIDPAIVEKACEVYRHPKRMLTNDSETRHHDCMTAALEAVTPLIVQDYIETDQQQANLIRMAQAKAWDEGWEARSTRPHLKPTECVPAPSHINPHRADDLEAAPSLIAAKALRDAADDWHAATTGTAPRMYLWLHARADALEAGQP